MAPSRECTGGAGAEGRRTSGLESVVGPAGVASKGALTPLPLQPHRTWETTRGKGEGQVRVDLPKNHK